VALAALLFFLFVGFLSLGAWQVERLQWKLDLIARVDARVHAAPVPAPAVADWPRVSAADDEYRQVSVTGRYLERDSAYVQAVTQIGTGFWLLTPLRRTDGSVVIVNRGFVSARPKKTVDSGSAAATVDMPSEAPPLTVTGLLRMPEPGGGFLRRNDAAADRWYSRDVAAIAASRRLGPVAPFFVDAAKSGSVADTPSTEPVGGLTVIQFHNSHLVYAITWFVLAAGTLAGGWQVRRAWIAQDGEGPTRI
jgi:surfeit locus 1 family protein